MAKKKLLINYPVPEVCYRDLTEEFDVTVSDHQVTREEFLGMIGEYDALYNYVQKIDEAVLDAGKNLIVVGNNGVGYDNVNVAYATQKGIAVINTPTQVTEATAEHTAALIICAMRQIPRLDREMRNGLWDAPIFPEKPTEVNGSTLGIIGFGRIGKRVCRKMQGFGMNVIYYDPFRAAPEVEEEFGVTYKELDEVLAEADCVTVHIPYVPENHHLFDAAAFAKMKKDAYFINASRGPVVDEPALYAALKDGVIKGAALDVFEHEPHPLPELFTLENITLTPHVASGTMKTRIAMCVEGLTGVAEVLRGNVPYNAVNKELFK